MQIIPLEATPNQIVTARLGGERYEIRLRDIGGMMVADVIRSDVPILRGVRVVAGTPLIPHPYLEAGQGNLIFLNSDDRPDAMPYWPDFGTRTRLIYGTQDELRGPGIPPQRPVPLLPLDGLRVTVEGEPRVVYEDGPERAVR